MDSRLVIGDEYKLGESVTARFLGTAGPRNYFYSEEYGVYIISLASKTQRIGNRVDLTNGSKYVSQRADFLSSGDRRNIIQLTGGLEEVTKEASAN